MNALVGAFPVFVKLRRLIVCSSWTKPSVQWVIRTLKHWTSPAPIMTTIDQLGSAESAQCAVPCCAGWILCISLWTIVTSSHWRPGCCKHNAQANILPQRRLTQKLRIPAFPHQSSFIIVTSCLILATTLERGFATRTSGSRARSKVRPPWSEQNTIQSIHYVPFSLPRNSLDRGR